MSLSALFDAFLHLATPATLAYGAAAMLLGILFGALPGLTAALGVALLTGLTFSLSTEHTLVILLCIYVGAIYGGSISAVLTNIPGTGAAIATAWEGHALARRGEAGLAIGTAATASFAGTMLGLCALALATPVLASAALKIASPEITLLSLLGLLLVGSLNGPGTALKGWMAGLTGLLISTVGLDAISATPRFTLGSSNLLGGVPFIPAMIGLFGVAQIVESLSQTRPAQIHSLPRVLPNWGTLIKHLPVTIKSGLMGIGIGITPGVGENIAALLAYSVARRSSKEPGRYREQRLCASCSHPLDHARHSRQPRHRHSTRCPSAARGAARSAAAGGTPDVSGRNNRHLRSSSRAPVRTGTSPGPADQPDPACTFHHPVARGHLRLRDWCFFP
jgi:putative tricarboxylic transport membrane protein